MSAIFGLFCRNGAPADQRDLAAMASLLPPELAARLQCWREGSVALGKAQGLHTSEDQFDAGIVEAGSCVIAACATLNNRGDLISALGLPGAEAAKVSDATLAGQAWLKWGEACAARLSGVWAMAIWDRRHQHLTVIRDQFSYLELSFHQSASHFAFAYRPKALLALRWVPKEPNLDRLVDSLAVIRSDAISSPWRAVQFIPAGHRLAVSATSCQMDRYWLPEAAPDIRYRHDDDYVEHLRELFDRSVEGYLRVPAKVGVTLSGGLDSALVCESAARQMKPLGRPLHAFTSVPVFDVSHLTGPTQFGDEGALASAVARAVGNVDHHLLPATDVGLIAGLSRAVAVTDSPDYAVGNTFWLWSMLDRCREIGVTALLMGAAGNTSVSWDGGSFVGHVSTWPPRRAALERWLTNPAANRADAWRGLMLAPFIPRRLRAWRYGSKTARYNSWTGYSAMNPRWFKKHGIEDRIVQSGRPMLFERPLVADPRDEQLQTVRTDRRLGFSGWSHLALASGVQPRDPTADHRVVEFCIGTPSRQFQRDGVPRFLARRLLDGRVPSEVAWNRRRGLQGADLVLRVRGAAAEFREVLADLANSPLARELLDLERIGQTLARTEGPLDPRLALECELILMRGIGMGLFIREAGL